MQKVRGRQWIIHCNTVDHVSNSSLPSSLNRPVYVLVVFLVAVFVVGIHSVNTDPQHSSEGFELD